METKICKKCGEEKRLNEFRGDKRQKHGIILTCKPCRRKEKFRSDEFLRDRYYRCVKRAEKFGVLSDLTFSQYKEVFYARKNCPYCGVKLTMENRSVDHIHPMYNRLGANIREDLICTCATCNKKKGKRHFYAFYQSSEKFTDKLFEKFMLDFYAINLDIPIKKHELPEVIEYWRQESEEWAAI